MASRNPYSSDENPYLAPEADDIESGEDIADEEMEDIRKKYLNHEASVQGVGGLYIFVAILLLIAASLAFGFGLTLLAEEDANLRRERGDLPPGFELFLGAFYLVFSALYFWFGFALRSFRNWARITVGIFTIPGLLGIPIGTLISGYILYLLFSEKGKYVCSPQYQEVIAATPHIKYRTSIIIKILAVILLGVLSLAIVGLVLGNRGR